MSLMRKMTIKHFGGTVAHVQTNPWCAYFTVEKVKKSRNKRAMKSWVGIVLHRQNRTNDISTCLWMVTTSNWHHIDVQPNQWQVESSPQSWNLPLTSIYYLIRSCIQVIYSRENRFPNKITTTLALRPWHLETTIHPTEGQLPTAQQAHGLGCPRGGILRFQETHHSWNVSHMGKWWFSGCCCVGVEWHTIIIYYLNTISKLLNHKRTWLRSWVEQLRSTELMYSNRNQ